MKKFIFFIVLFGLINQTQAQDDLLGMLQAEVPNKAVPVIATFKAPRVITGQSIEHTAAKHLNFVFLHRF
jgi:hypothetical protein